MNPPIPTRHLNQCATRWGLLPALLVVWLAPFLGGSVEPWSRAILFILLGLLLLIYPPNNGLTTRARLFLAILALLPLTAFLPANPGKWPAWRADLAQQHGVRFPGTLSAQPWLALDAWWLWLGALLWVWWLAGQDWTRATRKPLAELFAGGILLLAAGSIFCFHAHFAPPFWHNERLFGPFPNRNQTADLFSLTFILVAALLHMALLRRAKIAFLWAAGLLLLGYALILNYSRAGILLPAIGLAGYWVIDTLAKPSTKKIWIGLSLLLIGFSLLLAFGGSTLERFNTASAGGEGIGSGFRLLIFRDTLDLIAHNGWPGIGLAGFEWVFPLFRHLSLSEQRAIHPESDWLWLAAEIGWPGALAILGLALWLVSRGIRQAIKKPHPLRVAGSVCGALFILHGFFDVSGHRPGTFFPAFFLFTLAWPGEISLRRQSPAWLSRGAALFLLLTGAAWLLNGTLGPFWPGPQRLAADQRTIGTLITAQTPQPALPLIDQALAIAPLDWELYYQRGSCRILQRRDWPLVLADFRLACLLEPTSPRLPDIEGTGWLFYRPDLAALPWAENLRRLPPENRAGQYEHYLVESQPWPRLQAQLAAMAGNDPALQLVRLDRSSDADFPALLGDFLRLHPDLAGLDARQQDAVLDQWAGRGDAQRLLDFLQHASAPRPLVQARALARLRRFEEAVRLLLRTLPLPTIPPIQEDGSEDELTKQLYSSHHLLAGLALYQRQNGQNRPQDALLTLIRVARLPDAPPFVGYLLGQTRADLAEWEDAWTALDPYARQTADPGDTNAANTTLPTLPPVATTATSVATPGTP